MRASSMLGGEVKERLMPKATSLQLGKYSVRATVNNQPLSRTSSSASQMVISSSREEEDWVTPVSEIPLTDLTSTLLSLNLYSSFTIIITFITLMAIRYYITVYLLYIWITSQQHSLWQLIGLLVVVKGLFCVIVLKISLNNCQTTTQTILKQHWNSKYTLNEYFQAISWEMLGVSILRAFVPPELSFLYLKNTKFTVQIYASINYIYASIQAIYFYPYALWYFYESLQPSVWGRQETFWISVCAEALFVVVSLWLWLCRCC